MTKLAKLALFSCLVSPTLTSCGYRPPWLSKVVDSDTKVVTLGSPEEFDLGQAERYSYIVTFKSQLGLKKQGFAHFFSEYQAHYRYLADQYIADPRLKDIDVISGIDLSHPKLEMSLEDFPVPSTLQLAWNETRTDPQPGVITKVDFASFDDAKEMLQQWDDQGLLWFAEPNYNNQLSGQWDIMNKAYETKSAAWHKAIKLREAFAELEKIQGSADDQPIVAVMDSGTDVKHPALSKQIWQNTEVGTGDCGNDQYGCNTTNPPKGQLGTGEINPFGTSGFGDTCPKGRDGSCAENCCHGTHVAGIIAAYDSSSGSSVGGVCPICRIMTLRIVNDTPDSNGEGRLLDSSILRALKYVAGFRKTSVDDTDVRIINSSFGKFQRSRAVAVMVHALRSTNAGVLVVAAAGNEDTNKRQFPAALEDAIAVANIDDEGLKHVSSNFGRWVDVSAPGTRITSTVPGGTTEAKTGTSMSSPVVAGIAALVIAGNPRISFDGLKNRIIGGADPSIYTNGINGNYLSRVTEDSLPIPLLGSGNVNSLNAVKGVSEDVPAVKSLDRVGEGCASIGPASSSFNKMVLLILFLLPLGACVRHTRLKKHVE